ncbi:hypothetical protein EI546_02195 [Aequorivita sp. H23M31]|uniref:Uncharacterized protein n=1 Tax=Aequorivita ciconiae TaxID=2494375 RepID=A0A410G048_9FLAO|nr:hypothetical protein [Aequorivita sp. H23M31]QAA80611.1 hypothetical protein EI546_02195 [Aequorivita sp. H23M31]
MIKNFLLIFILFNYSICVSQDYELRVTPYVNSKIVFKDSTVQSGLLKLANSAFSPHFKQEEGGKPQKLNYELIYKIYSNPNTENERVFQYVNHNYSKFKIFVELIYDDVFQIYINSNDSAQLFYSEFDRQSMGELMAIDRFERNLDFNRRLKTSDTITLPNGKEMVLPMRYSYYNGLNYSIAYGKAPTLIYYISRLGLDKIYKVEKNKRFLKKAEEFLSDCAIIKKDLQENKISVSDIPTFIEYYKDVCPLDAIGK